MFAVCVFKWRQCGVLTASFIRGFPSTKTTHLTTSCSARRWFFLKLTAVASVERLELPTFWFVVRRSIPTELNGHIYPTWIGTPSRTRTYDSQGRSLLLYSNWAIGAYLVFIFLSFKSSKLSFKFLYNICVMRSSFREKLNSVLKRKFSYCIWHMLYLLYKKFNLEQVAGIEPASTAWQAVILPLNYTYILVDL